MKEDRTEKKNKRLGMVTSLAIHALLLILFIFLIAWREQYPPPEPIGMSINFGTSDSGSGEVQPKRQETQEEQPVEEIEEEVVEEIQEPIETPPVDEILEPVEEAVTEALQKEGPVKVEEKKPEPIPEPEGIKDEPKPVEETPKPVVEEKKEEPKLEAVYTGPKANETNDASSQGEKDTEGDQGSPDGNLDARTQYGGPGEGGGGFSHNLTGWGTNFKLPDEKPEATGKLEFKIQVDGSGNIIRIFISKRIGNSEAEKFYRDIIEREMKFYRTSGTGEIPNLSDGTITLNLKVK